MSSLMRYVVQFYFIFLYFLSKEMSTQFIFVLTFLTYWYHYAFFGVLSVITFTFIFFVIDNFAPFFKPMFGTNNEQLLQFTTSRKRLDLHKKNASPNSV